MPTDRETLDTYERQLSDNEAELFRLRAENARLKQEVGAVPRLEAELAEEKRTHDIAYRKAVENFQRAEAAEAENARLKDGIADEYKAASEAYCELQDVLRVTTDDLKREIAENARLRGVFREAMDDVYRRGCDSPLTDLAVAALEKKP